MRIFTPIILALIVVFFASYTLIGTSSRVEEIKRRAPDVIAANSWKILRYEGYTFGNFSNHGGKVWYHVKDINNNSIQYRIYITMWENELHFHYGAPEKLSRIELNMKE